MKGLTIFGTGGHAQNLMQEFLKSNLNIKLESLSIEKMGQQTYLHAIIAIGDNKLRDDCFYKALEQGVKTPSVYFRENGLEIKNDSKGNQFLRGSVVYSSAKLGRNILVNSGAVIEHHSVINDSAHICPGAVVLGGASIGKFCKIGANSVVHPNIIVSDSINLGALSVVTKNLTEKGNYFGCPAT